MKVFQQMEARIYSGRALNLGIGMLVIAYTWANLALAAGRVTLYSGGTAGGRFRLRKNYNFHYQR